MTSLVNHREESAGEVASVVTQCDADVAGADGCAEWMRTEIEATGLQIEAQLLSHSLGERALSVERKLAIVQLLGHSRRSITQRLNQGDKLHSELCKELRELRSGHARLVIFEQGV